MGVWVDVTELITFGAIGLTVLSVLISLVLLHREHRIRLRWDFLRVLFSAGGIAGMILLLRVEPRLEYVAIAAAIGAIIGFVQGRMLSVRIVDGIPLGRRTLLAMLAWGAGIIATQVAAYLNRADVVEYALVGASFGAGLALGTFFGSGRAVRVAKQGASAPAAATAALLLIALVGAGATSAVAQEDEEINPHAGTYEGVEIYSHPSVGDLGQYRFAAAVAPDGSLEVRIFIDGGYSVDLDGLTVDVIITGDGSCSGSVSIDGSFSCAGTTQGQAVVVGGGANFPVPGSGAFTASGTMSNGELIGTMVGEDGTTYPFTGTRDPATAPVITTTTSTSSTSTTAPAAGEEGTTTTTTTIAPVVAPIAADEAAPDPAEDITPEEAAGGAAAAAAAALASLLSSTPGFQRRKLIATESGQLIEKTPTTIRNPHENGPEFLPVNKEGKVWYGDWYEPAEVNRRIGNYHEEVRVREEIERQTAPWRERQEELRRERVEQEAAQREAKRRQEQNDEMQLQQLIDMQIKKSKEEDDKYSKAVDILFTARRDDGTVDPEKLARFKEILGQRVKNDLRIPPEKYEYSAGDVLRQTANQTFHDARKNAALRTLTATLTGGSSEVAFGALDAWYTAEDLSNRTPLDQELGWLDYANAMSKKYAESKIPSDTAKALILEQRLPTQKELVSDLVNFGTKKISSRLTSRIETNSPRSFMQHGVDKINGFRERMAGGPVRPLTIPGNLPEEIQNFYHDQKKPFIEKVVGAVGDEVKKALSPTPTADTPKPTAGLVEQAAGVAADSPVAVSRGTVTRIARFTSPGQTGEW